MDEPLSNLDAALRVQTRAEILKLQKRLGTTTIYVTHDQVEAMTMGDRIAVMRLGVLQQIGTPEELYLHPANTFVATFIGSPAMNLVPSGVVGLGDGRLAGFRPEHVQLGNGRPDAAHYDAIVEVVEYLGSEQVAHTMVQDQPVVVKLPVEPRLQRGSRTTFSVPLDKVLLFDRETERTLGSAATA
jgi:multiple sugar transport system ATP-binding protein